MTIKQSFINGPGQAETPAITVSRTTPIPEADFDQHPLLVEIRLTYNDGSQSILRRS